MNPLKYLSPALYAALTSPALVLAGAPVPVHEHLQANYGGHYVLLQQPTHVPSGGGSQGCRAWSCTALVDLITQFAQGAISSAPVDELLEQVCARLEGQRLDLGAAGLDCGPATFEPSQEVRELTGETVAVRRLIRFRWEVYHHS